MIHRYAAAALLTVLAGMAQAQSADSSGTMNSQAGPSASSSDIPSAPARRIQPSRPSTASGPTVSGGMTMPDSSAASVSSFGTRDSSTIGGSGSAGLAAMGGGMDTSGGAAPEMGSGAMTDCPMGTSRKMGLCVPYGQSHKKQP